MKPCRPREVPEDDEPFLGSDADAEAVGILLAAQKSIMAKYNAAWAANPDQPLGEIAPAEDIEAMALIFHACDYLCDRVKYREVIHPQLHGYLVIE